MKYFSESLITSTLLFLLSFSSMAQSQFKQGYIVQNNGDKLECMILEESWKQNPTSFSYKLNENSEVQIGTLSDIQSFGVGNLFKFVKKEKFLPKETLDNPVFLNVLVEGAVSIYHYKSSDDNLFFYKKADDKNIYELQYRYTSKSDGDGLSENKFRGQLYEAFGSNKLYLPKIKSLNYKRNDLLNIVTDFNKETNVTYSKFYKATKEKVNFYLKAGLGSSPVVIENTSIGEFADFGSNSGLRVGFEIEYFIPYESQKWAITVSPMFKFVSTEKVSTTPERVFNDTFDYSAIEMQFGPRYYFSSKKSDMRIYANAGLFVEVPLGNTYNYLEESVEVGLNSVVNSYVGAGLQYKRFGLEVSYLPTLNLIESSNEFFTQFDTIAFHLTFNLVKN